VVLYTCIWRDEVLLKSAHLWMMSILKLLYIHSGAYKCLSLLIIQAPDLLINRKFSIQQYKIDLTITISKMHWFFWLVVENSSWCITHKCMCSLWLFKYIQSVAISVSDEWNNTSLVLHSIYCAIHHVSYITLSQWMLKILSEYILCH